MPSRDENELFRALEPARSLLLHCHYHHVFFLAISSSTSFAKLKALASAVLPFSRMAPFNQHIEKSNVTSKPTAESGNGLFATKQIKLENSILSVDRPLMLALDTPRLKDTCYHCLMFMEKSGELKRADQSQAKTLKACAGCSVVRYCDKVCAYLFWLRTEIWLLTRPAHDSQNWLAASVCSTFHIDTGRSPLTFKMDVAFPTTLIPRYRTAKAARGITTTNTNARFS